MIECLPDTQEAMGSFLSNPPPNIMWWNCPIGKQKAETKYSQNDFTVPREHRILIDVGFGRGVYVLR